MTIQDEFPTKSKEEQINLKCPGCGRPTRRKGSPRMNDDMRRPQAVLADGTCTPCWVRKKGVDPKAFYDGKRGNRGENKYRPAPLTEEDIHRLRAKLRDMECDRLARGVPPEGMDTKDWSFGNGGLYSWEV